MGPTLRTKRRDNKNNGSTSHPLSPKTMTASRSPNRRRDGRAVQRDGSTSHPLLAATRRCRRRNAKAKMANEITTSPSSVATNFVSVPVSVPVKQQRRRSSSSLSTWFEGSWDDAEDEGGVGPVPNLINDSSSSSFSLLSGDFSLDNDTTTKSVSFSAEFDDCDCASDVEGDDLISETKSRWSSDGCTYRWEEDGDREDSSPSYYCYGGQQRQTATLTTTTTKKDAPLKRPIRRDSRDK